MAALSPAPLSSPDFIRLQAFLEYVVQSEPGYVLPVACRTACGGAAVTRAG